MSDHFRSVALEHASRLLNHGPTVLVTSVSGERRNVMAAAWSMPVEFTPPRISVVIDKHTFTRDLVAASGAFGICLPGTALVDLTYAVGSQSGRTVDKFAGHGIAAKPGPVLGVPLPLISSGGSALLAVLLAIGVVLSIARTTAAGEETAADDLDDRQFVSIPGRRR